MALCLSNEELEELTGYKRGAEQARWLENHGYYVECNARGIPRITHAQVDDRRKLQTSTAIAPPAKTTEPNVVGFRDFLQKKR